MRTTGNPPHVAGAAILLSALLLLPLGAAAQQISGLVAEQGSLAPAADAVITLYRVTGEDGELSPVGTTVTDEEGFFIFIPTQPGQYRVQAEHGGLLSPLSPTYEVGPSAGTDELVLMVPSPLLMLASNCNVEASPGAVVVGVVRDAASEVSVPLARVTARWIEGPGFQELDTRADDRGRFLFCGIPTNGIVRFRGEGFGQIGEWTEVELLRPALVFHDVDMGLATTTSTGTEVLAELVLGRAAGTMADLRGQLLDQMSEEPIAQAVVRVRGSGFQAVTDPQGRFSFTDLQPGTYTLEIQHLGYSVQTSEVALAEGQDVSVRLRLSQQAVELEGVEVVARSRQEETIRTSSFQRYVVSGNVLAEEEARGASLAEVLRRNVVGMRVTERATQSGTQLCLETNRRIQRLTRFEQLDLNALERELGTERRGLDQEESGCNMVQVVLDGIRLSDTAGMPVASFLQAFTLQDIESVEFLPPAQGSTLYGIGGNVSNGVLVIHTRGKGPYRSAERDRQ